MTTPTPVDSHRTALLRADLDAVARELDRVDALGDTAAVVRARILLGPRISQLRRAIAVAERDGRTTTEVHG
jgi:hypothetical protein